MKYSISALLTTVLLSSTAIANPMVRSIIPLDVELSLHHFDLSPTPELSLNYSYIQTPFSNTFFDGGGIGSISIPNATSTNNSFSLRSNVNLTTTEPGNANGSLGAEALVTVTNNGLNLGHYLFSYGYGPNTQVNADPLTDVVSYNWDIGLVGLGKDHQGHVCDMTMSDLNACNNMFDSNSYNGLLTMGAGESVTFDLIMDAAYNVYQDPEPNMLYVWGCLLGIFGGYYVTKRSRVAANS